VAGVRCYKCGQPMNPVQVMLSVESGLCQHCIDAQYTRVTGRKVRRRKVHKSGVDYERGEA